jgi:hypothetical protein
VTALYQFATSVRNPSAYAVVMVSVSHGSRTMTRRSGFLNTDIKSHNTQEFGITLSNGSTSRPLISVSTSLLKLLLAEVGSLEVNFVASFDKSSVKGEHVKRDQLALPKLARSVASVTTKLAISDAELVQYCESTCRR